MHNHSPSKHAWLGWAIFLGVSWTWCIGMYLPVLLIQDYGPWAWLVFAIPNCLGAAAMAWTLDAQRSRSIAIAHRPAIIVFSTITIAFQIFFAVWIFSRPPWQAAFAKWYLPGVALIAALSIARRWSRSIAFAILLASLLCAIGMFARGEANLTGPGYAHEFSTPPPLAIAWLTPVCLFGFLLCPYLDPTFHRARQQLPDRQAKRAFAVGFCIVFLSAIVLSLFYARPVHAAMAASLNPPLILKWVKLYWMLQLGFTIGVHLIGDDASDPRQRDWPAATIAIAACACAATALAIGAAWGVPGKTVYRAFLGFYGLVFPAYVWLAIIPRRGLTAPGRRTLTVMAIAIALAGPMFYLAFIDQQLIWGVPAVGIVLLSRLLIPGIGGKAATNHESAPVVQQNSAPTS